MRLLLDTNALLLWLNDDDRMRRDARAAIIDPANEVSVSVVSLWEVMVKVRTGKLDVDPISTLENIRAEPFTSLEIANEHLRTLLSLPKHHRDPFDHLLIAQAISEDLIFVTRHAEVAHYPVRLMRC